MNSLTHFIQSLLSLVGIRIVRLRDTHNPLRFLSALGITTVLDIGANVGQFAAETRKALPEAHIYSFEPLRECFERLVESRKGDELFAAYPFALGAKTESLTMHKSSYTPSSSFKPMAHAHKEAFPHTATASDETVDVRRLDEIAPSLSLSSRTLVKIDVQGYEDKVLEGGRETIKKASAVIIEASFAELYEGQPLFDDIYSALRELGFSYCGAVGMKRHPTTGAPLFEDAIFIKS